MSRVRQLRRLRHLLVFVGFRIGMAVIGVLPRRVAQRLGAWAGRATARLARGRWEMALRHARRLEAAAPEAHAEAVFAGYGRYWAEALWIRPRRIPELVAGIEIEGLHHVLKAKAEGAGLICAVPHLGNWEIAGPIAVREELGLVAVAEDLPNRYIRDWFVTLRNRLGIGIILATNGKAVMRQLEEAIAANGTVALLCDRDLRGRGVRVSFFGEETTLPAGPVSLALRTGAPILPVAVYFLPDGGHHLVVKPPLELPSDGDRKEALVLGTQRVAEGLEELIRAAPEQWHLLQPNWPSDRRHSDAPD